MASLLCGAASQDGARTFSDHAAARLGVARLDVTEVDLDAAGADGEEAHLFRQAAGR